MADELHLTVLTPERSVLEATVYSVTAPGAGGYLGILKNHAPLITSLIPGKLTVKDLQEKPTVYAIGGGFLEVAANRVIILADTLDELEEIDLGEAMEARTWAERKLREAQTPVNRELAAGELARIQNQIFVKRNPGPSV